MQISEDQQNKPVSFPQYVEQIAAQTDDPNTLYALRSLLAILTPAANSSNAHSSVASCAPSHCEEGVSPNFTKGASPMSPRGADPISLPLDLLKLWAASHFIAGGKASTLKRYAGKIHALYRQWLSAPTEDPFLPLADFISPHYQTNDTLPKHNLLAVRKLFAKSETAPDRQAADIFLYLLYNPSATLLDLINLTFDQYDPFCPQLDAIIDSRKRANGRKYIFELNQGKQRPTGILKSITETLTPCLRNVGMSLPGGFTREAATAIWIAAALQLNITLPEIRALITTIPAEYPALIMARPAELSRERREEIICRVADHINDNTQRWFVMHLRAGHNADEICRRIERDLPGRLQTMTIFNPTRNIARREGKKIIKEEVPIVPNLLFFKTQRAKVKSLFSKIGDIAWCYRTANLPDSDYSVISSREMSRFQRCVGQFTDDIQVELVAEDPRLRRGRRVRVTGGIMAGYEGEIQDIEGAGDRRIFKLRIASGALLTWTASVPAPLLLPL